MDALGPSSKEETNAVLTQCQVVPFDEISDTKITARIIAKPQPLLFRPVLASLVVTLTSLVIGAGIGYPSTAIPDLNRSHGPYKIDPFQQSWCGGLYFLGAVPGALLSGYCMDRYGRKAVIMAGALPHVLGWILIAASVNVAMMYAGRLLTGFCFALTLSIVGVYISEIAPPTVRGTLMSFHELELNVGTLLMYVLGTFIPWTWLAIVCVGLLTVMAVAMFFMPETPRWLVMDGQRERAEATLRWLRGERFDWAEELSDITESVKDTREMTPWLAFVRPPLLKLFAISEFLYVLQELSGINVVRQYTVTLFDAAGTDLNPNLETIIVGCVLVLGSALFTSVVEKRERRVFLLISSAMMALSLGAMGAFLQVKKKDAAFAYRKLFWLPLLSLATVCVGYVLGVGPMPYVVTSEVFSNRARGRASGIGVATLCFFGFLITKFFVNISDAIGEPGAFFLCGSICAGGFVVIFFTLPETKGKKLEKIQNEIIVVSST